MDIRKLPLSKRLRMNVAMVEECEAVADVGCDHAYCSIYLTGNGVAKRSIAMDVNQGPIDRAAENIALYGLTDRIVTRRSDGLERLVPGEADTILISGMGGSLMQDILERGAQCVQYAQQLVLQPQSELAEFRRYLHSRGLGITDEEMCCEDEKYYTVMRAVHMEPAACAWDGGEELREQLGVRLAQEYVYRFGPCLLRKKHPVLLDFLEREYAKKKQLYEQLCEQNTERSLRRAPEIKQEAAGLAELIYYMSRVRQK